MKMHNVMGVAKPTHGDFPIAIDRDLGPLPGTLDTGHNRT